MIVKMKEIWLLTTTNTVDETIESLGKLGVVDVAEVNQSISSTTAYYREQIEKTQKAITILADYQQAEKLEMSEESEQQEAKDPKRIVNRVITATTISESAKESLEKYSAQASWYRIWGEGVDKDDIDYLREHGIYVKLYILDKNYLDEIKDDYYVVPLHEDEDKIPVALFSQDPAEKLDREEVSLPSMTAGEVGERIKRKHRQLTKVDDFLREKTMNLPLLRDFLIDLKERLEAQEVREGMADIHGQVKYLKGYLPKDKVAKFEETATAQEWGYQIMDPENPDTVPVHIKNPKWIEIINPVMKFIDIVPGYKEVDVSIYFLIAFAVFFAMLVGDAGYGLLFLLITFILRKKIPGQIKTLIYVLSGTTILWGVFSGTYFGSETIASLPYLRDLVIPNIASFGVDNISFMMHLSFLIGAIHLTVAHAVRAIRYINSIKILSEVGWIFLVWGLYFITEQLVLGNAVPSWYQWLFYIGGSLVILFSKESTSLLKSIFVSIANLPLSLISGFSDIVSYVRLFAVGLATAMVAAAFNNMAFPNGIADMGFLQMIMATIALLLGHTLNIALALMAVMVHGIRLNILEFAGHLGVEFTGNAYKPFTLRGKTNHKIV